MATTYSRSDDSNVLNNLFARAYTVNWEVVAYVVIFLLAMFTRFYMLGERTMSHDESLHTVYSNNLYERADFRHSPLMHGPILFHFTALSYALFGVNDFSARVYTAVLGVMIVMFPLLLRRWLGRTGAILASTMLLLSPLMVYYSRYIRHDMPSILSAMLMFYGAMMYLSGPENQRRKAHWLYIIAAAMIWNLGSKETAFIYVAIFGAFLTLYWLVRMAQYVYNVKGKIVFANMIVGILLAGLMALLLIVVISISLSNQPTLTERLTYISNQSGYLFNPNQPVSLGFTTVLTWSGLVFVGMLAVIIGPALWVYRKGELHFTLIDALMGLVAVALVAAITSVFGTRTTEVINGVEIVRDNTSAVAFALGAITGTSLLLIYAAVRIRLVRSFRKTFITLLIIMLATCSVLIVIEELSHVPSRGDETAAPPIPGQETTEEVVTSTFTPFPLIVVWVLGAVVVGGLLIGKQRGLFKFLDNFPEFDVLIVMGSLILPWLTAVFIVSTRGSPNDFVTIGESFIGLANVLPVAGAERVGQFVVGFIAWVPMMTVAVLAGLLWNWRRWLVASLIFHAIFAFFFTTVFTNIEGLATGMIYSLQYWLEQQGVRRGSQPQYYYALIILPFYEFLPIIGSFLAMISGMVFFWKRQRRFDVEQTPPEDTTDMPDVDAGQVMASATDADIEADDPNDDAVETLVESERERSARWRLTEVPFLLFVGWWAILNLVGYTLAGEKMPWLGTHMTVPMILLAGWYFGSVFDRIRRDQFESRGWVYLLLLPFLLVGLAQLVAPYLAGRPPFAGVNQQQLTWTYNWLAALLVSGGVIYAIVRLTDFTGWAHLRQMLAVVVFSVLALLTFRSTWLSSFIHYDEATEFLVYAHAGPANKAVTEELAELSFRVSDGMDIRVLHDDKFSWPGTWYLRDFDNSIYIGQSTPTQQQLDDAVAVIVGDSNRLKVEPLLEDRFQRFDHIRMWWPIQDYFGMSAESLGRFFDFEYNPVQEPGQLRRGIFNIWWARDYSTYAAAQDKSITLTDWPVSDRMHVYIRKDFAAQVWPYGVGDATVQNPFTTIEENVCATNWQERTASLVISPPENPLSIPVGMDVAPDGRLFVAEDAGREISVFSPDGMLLGTIGQAGTAAQQGAFFERPHSVGIDSNGNIYVVDTWNYLIRKFDADQNFLLDWGQAVTAGFDVQTQPTDGFWGPRDVAIDPQGNVYISDTGNKRIRVYDPDGNWLRDIGTGGGGDGQLNEPAGIAIHPDGRLFVADTWNRRVAVFSTNGTFIENYRVRGWIEELGNRPYLAIDPDRDLLYVTDPDAGRVLVYNTSGDCLGSFGQLNQDAPNASQFATIGGIAVDDVGNLYVADLGSGRILKFDPYEPPIVVPPAADEAGEAGEDAGANLPFLNPQNPVESAGDGEEQGSVPVFLFEETEEAAPLPFLVNPEATEEVDSAD